MTLISTPMYGENDVLSMIVGTYNRPGSEGLFSFAFNQNTGEFEALDSLTIDNPSYLTFNKDGNIIYAVSEMNVDNSGISAIVFDKQTGKMNVLNSKPLNGSPCYVSTNGKIALTANYGGGNVDALVINNNGELESATEVFQGSIGGPDSTRQNLPHVHSVVFSPDGRRAYATDFSSDRIIYLDVFADAPFVGKSVDKEGNIRYVKVTADSGPRHLIFDNTSKYAYLISELSGNITVFQVNDNDLEIIQEINCDPVYERASADIHISPDGKFLYASNRRKNDGIAIFDIDATTGKLQPVDYQLTGAHPRHFNITPNGKFILVACRDNDSVEVYERDPQTGKMDLKSRIPVYRPVCVQFAP